jgi:Stealth protein CR2, conserved region 2/Mannosyltransferase putative/Stealth protein CR3, conserved region 3/Stealth protein CR4, conserved region 4
MMSAALELNDSTARERVRSAVAGLPEMPDSEWRGRGIVICAGGVRYFICAWVCINMLRKHRCDLPIELWYLHAGEMNGAMRALVEPLGVACVNAQEVRKRYPARILNGWELKAYALLHCSFREVLLLDADDVPILDPTFLFETPQFAETGAIFWPDYGRLEPSRAIWGLTGVAYRDEPEFESGQIALDKERCFRPLALAMWFNEYSDYWYRHIHGDKETFHLAWRRLDAPYAMPQRGIHPLPATMCQHDFMGRRIFQHRNNAKWNLRCNPRIPGFSQEEECLRFIEQLEPQWSLISGVRVYRGDGKEPDEALAAANLTGGSWIYERVGYDKRRMTFLEDGFIGQGAAGMEVCWDIRRVDGVLSLDIQSPQSLTCRLTPGPDGGWSGRWDNFERMPIELRPELDATYGAGMVETGAGTVDSCVRETIERLTGAKHLYRRMGYDARPMEFRSDGGIGAGGERLEKIWRIHRRDGDMLLDIGHAGGLTCRLKLDEGGVWRGRWENFEQMPVEVYPLAEPAATGGIDAVYTWVDGELSAPVLRLLLDAERKPALAGAATQNRYRSIGELRYSLRSLHAYAPWVRRVFLVTNGILPQWLNLDCPKLCVVNHAEIFENEKALPSFNSHAIELNLHRIPGLAQTFLYFNDDLFLGQPVCKEDFLPAENVQNFFFTDWNVPRGKTEQAHDRAFGFTLKLLDQAYGARPRRMPAHVPQLYRVEALEEICRRWKSEVDATLGNRVRSGNDAVLRILYAYHLLESPAPPWAARRVCLPQGRDYVFAAISNNHAYTRQGLSKAAEARPKFLCVNDEIAGGSEACESIFGEVREFLARQYPEPSPFERQAEVAGAVCASSS